MSELGHLSIDSVRGLLDNREISSVELTQHYLDRIGETNQDLNSFITVSADHALKQAAESDSRRANGESKGTLDGIPMSLKDIFATKGIRTMGASKILDNFVPPYDSFVTSQLNKAGAVMLGKTNCDEFAMGTTNEHSAYGPVKNPWNKDKVAGGSSGGSTVSVSADQCVFSIGTDTGGSIRLPASWNNVVGLRPTYGRVSRRGVYAMASSLDQVGAFGRSTEDVAEVMRVISEYDSLDSTHAHKPIPDFVAEMKKDVRGLKVGVIDQFFGQGVDPNIKSTVQTAIDHLASLGVIAERVSMPIIDKALAVYYIICPAEVSTNLERYDGIKYGYSSILEEDDHSLIEVYGHSRHNALGSEAKRRSLLGGFVLSSGYYEAYYHKAMSVRAMIISEFRKLFEKFDLLVGPVAPVMPFNIGENVDNPLALYMADVLAVPVNIAGLPAASVPCGFHEGLPIGLQIIGNQFAEDKILQLAYAYEKSKGWLNLHPTI